MRIWSYFPILIFLLFVSGITTVQALVEEEEIFFIELRRLNVNFNGRNENVSDPCSWNGVNCSSDGNNVISM